MGTSSSSYIQVLSKQFLLLNSTALLRSAVESGMFHISKKPIQYSVKIALFDIINSVAMCLAEFI